MDKKDSYEKINVPGIWFGCSEEPANQLSRYVYDLAVELGLPIVYIQIPLRKKYKTKFSIPLKPNVLRLRQTN